MVYYTDMLIYFETQLCKPIISNVTGPYMELFALDTTSATSLNLNIDITGPKICRNKAVAADTVPLAHLIKLQVSKPRFVAY